jgi:hypothetical protein
MCPKYLPLATPPSCFCLQCRCHVGSNTPRRHQRVRPAVHPARQHEPRLGCFHIAIAGVFTRPPQCGALSGCSNGSTYADYLTRTLNLLMLQAHRRHGDSHQKLERAPCMCTDPERTLPKAPGRAIAAQRRPLHSTGRCRKIMAVYPVRSQQRGTIRWNKTSYSSDSGLRSQR